MDSLAGALAAQEKGIEVATKTKYNSSWRNWLEFCLRAKISCPYLEGYSPINKARILCAFMDRVRRGEFSRKDSVKGDTARTALDHVATTIKSSGRRDPRLDDDGETNFMIQRQTRSYKKVDAPTKHQKALPPQVYRHMLHLASLPREKARAKLLAGAVFFCMRSCEFTKTSRSDQKTRAIRPCDISFRVCGVEMPHDHPLLHLAETVSITFGIQKSDVLDETVTQYRSDDHDLCPVEAWATVIRRLKSYPGYDAEWPVYTFHDGQHFSHLHSSEFLMDIRAAVDVIGPAILGFTSADVGIHSNRSGGAMMMYLAKTPPYTIMMIGRWSSNAFLRYIEKQVLEFSRGVSTKMLQCNTFFNIPLKPWTQTNPDFTQSIHHYYLPALRQVFGQHGSSLRDSLFYSISTALPVN